MTATNCEAMRIDRLLVYLRFARTRSIASAMVEAGHMRCNGDPISRISTEIRCGDVLTFMHGNEVKIVEILSLPQRRGSAEIARTHYRELDRRAKTAIATKTPRDLEGKRAT